jgi:hypothetical protein
MALKTRYVRDGRNQIIGSVTSGFSQDREIVRDNHGQIIGSTNGLFHITRRGTSGSIVSLNTADAGLLFNRKK